MLVRSSLLKRITAAACSVCLAGTVLTAHAEETEAGVNTLKGASLTLNGEIGVNFYLDLQDTDSLDRIVLEGPKGETAAEVGELEPVSSGEYAGLYKLTYLVDPAQTEESVSISLQKDGEPALLYSASGTAYGDEGAQFSVKDYIEQVKENENAGSDLSALADALDTYGRYSAVQFGNAADPGLDNILPDISAADLEKYKFVREGELPEGVNLLGAALVLDSTTAFRLYFDSDPGSATIDGSPAEVFQRDGMYCIEAADIAAADLNASRVAVVGNCKMKFSALSYAYSLLKSSEEDEESDDSLVKLAKALYAYSFAADMYFEASAGESPSLSETELELTETDDDIYAFSYGGETFTAQYTPYIGGNWKVVDSYKITNRADMVIICERLLKLNKVRGRITRWRTAKDMADEWEIHNRGYSLALAYSMEGAAARLKDVDMDKKDQGKTFDDFLAEFLGR